MSFTGGKLKLKGGDLPGVKKKRKKEDSKGGLALALAGSEGAQESNSRDAAEELKRALHGYALDSPDETKDRRTAAEKKYDEHMKKTEAKRLEKIAKMSHRERIKEFNDHLTNLSEHHDIPKVGPG